MAVRIGVERGRREEIIFSLARENHATAKSHLLSRLKQPAPRSPRAEFDRLFMRFPDGVTRNRPEIFDMTPRNVAILYWPEVPDWARQAGPDLYMPDEEYYQIAEIKNNPLRETAWTGLLYDKVSGTWMVSCGTPVDIDGLFNMLDSGDEHLKRN